MSKKKNTKKKKSTSQIKNNTKNNNVIKKENTKSFINYYIIITVITIAIFGLIYGFKILNPTYTDWLFTASGDLMQHYVGWEAFRMGEWTFPIGLTNASSYPNYISVIYTDSIPLVAVFFKLISFVLPASFQYLGLYGLLCFILQSVLTAKIIKKFTDSKLNIIVASILFTLIPSMIFRMYYHTALGSQWLLLLSLETLFLYHDFKEGKKIYIIWGIIAMLVCTIHLYYLVMCGVILTGYILLDILNTKKIKKSLLLLLIYISSALISLWLFGGFINASSSDTFGFGLFSYNLNGLINPQGWSIFINDMKMIPEQYEGFSYLGLGVIILIIVSIIVTIIWYIKDKEDLKQYKNLIISLSFISLISTFIALSPRAYIGNHLLYELKLPDFINNLWAIFRSTGRFIWPLIHILMLLSVIIILKRLKWNTALLILSIVTIIQVIDIGAYISEKHEFYSREYEKTAEYDLYQNEYLRKVADNKDIKLLVLVSDDLYDTDKIIYADWALNNNIKTNKMFFARTSFNEILEKSTIKQLEEKSENEVFVFSTRNECLNNNLNCYKLPNNYYLGYVNEL